MKGNNCECLIPCVFSASCVGIRCGANAYCRGGRCVCPQGYVGDANQVCYPVWGKLSLKRPRQDYLTTKLTSPNLLNFPIVPIKTTL